MQGPCSSCHTIRGTPARSNVGPDLTHIASRTSLAGVTIPNTRAELARWITDSQSIKPGNQMPDVDLDAAKLRALVAYLETLK
jgi:cytochrome c oxidase subunit II